MRTQFLLSVLSPQQKAEYREPSSSTKEHVGCVLGIALCGSQGKQKLGEAFLPTGILLSLPNLRYGAAEVPYLPEQRKIKPAHSVMLSQNNNIKTFEQIPHSLLLITYFPHSNVLTIQQNLYPFIYFK